MLTFLFNLFFLRDRRLVKIVGMDELHKTFLSEVFERRKKNIDGRYIYFKSGMTNTLPALI